MQTRQVLVDLQDDNLRLVEDALCNAGCAGEVEIPVPIHRRDREHCDVHGEKMLIILRHVAENHRDIVAKPLVGKLSLIGGAMPGMIGKMRLLRVLLHDLERAEEQIAAHFHVLQLGSLCQSNVEQLRHAQSRPVVHPIAAVDNAHRLFGRAELRTIFRAIIHGSPS